MVDREQKVREHANKIWEDEGRPDGRHDDHWRRAEEHVSASENANDGQEPEENWRAEAGLAEENEVSGVLPVVIPPD